MVKASCRFCRQTDEIRNLVSPCDCHKKNDYSLCHVACVEKYISQLSQSQCDQKSELARVCPVCSKPFRVKLLWQFTPKRIWSSTSLSIYYQVVMLLLSLASFCSASWLVFHSTRTDEEPPPAGLVWFMLVLVLTGTVFTIHKVYERWKRHQLDAKVLDIV